MFDHVTVRVPDLDAAARFYELVFTAIAFRDTATSGGGYREWNDFSIARAAPDAPRTRGLHVGFAAPSREHVDAFWSALTGAGYQDDGPPGPRPQYSDSYYGAFVLDPAGDNSIEAVHHDDVRGDGGVIDHLWIRVADLDASTRFYETIAPYAGYRADVRPRRSQFSARAGSFSILTGTPTERAHLAFPAPERETVDRFHEAATRAGYADNGAPGERPLYHPGYYSAYVLDPGGNNVEVVHHG